MVYNTIHEQVSSEIIYFWYTREPDTYYMYMNSNTTKTYIYTAFIFKRNLNKQSSFFF